MSTLEGILCRRIFRYTVLYVILTILLLRRRIYRYVILTILLLLVRLGKNSCVFGLYARNLALNLQRVNENNNEIE